MRTIQVCPPRSRAARETAVRELRFDPTGARVFASVGVEEHTRAGRSGFTTAVFEYDLAADRTRTLADALRTTDPDAPPVARLAATADARLAVVRFGPEPMLYDESLMYLIDLARPDGEPVPLPIDLAEYSGAVMAFTPDGKWLVAVRYRWEGRAPVTDVARLPVEALTRPPSRFRDATNPLTGDPVRLPIRPRLAWRSVAAIPPVAGHSVGASPDGRRVAAGMVDGSVHVVSLGSRRVTASFPWADRTVRDRAAVRVGFDPAGKWVVWVANGRVFARPLTEKAGRPWQTKSTLGYVLDFGFHPSGHPLAVVDEAGYARDLDPATGSVRRSFRWVRTPLYSVAFSPDGLTCAAGGGGGRVVIWDVDG